MMGTTTKRFQPTWGVQLLASDYYALARSWIKRGLAVAAMIRRVSSQQGREIVGQKGKQDFAGLLIPYYLPGESHPHTYRIRRDNLDYTIDGGKPKAQRKYLGAQGCADRPYFPPNVSVDQLQDLSIPILITEVEKKALVLQQLAYFDSEVPRFIPIALSGVWSWRGTIGKAGGPNGERFDLKGPLNGLCLINWASRSALILLDANVYSDEQFKRALMGLSRELTCRNASVQFIDIPPECKGTGVDDLIAVSGPEQVLAVFDKPIDGKRLLINFPASKTRAITWAIARAVGIEVEP